MTGGCIDRQAAPRARRDDLWSSRRHAGRAVADPPGDAGLVRQVHSLPSPMSLFGAAARSPGAGAAPAPAAPPAWAMRVEALLVRHGSGNRCQVRLSLGDDGLPGTAVEIGETGGEWHVGFFCRIDAVRERLAGLAAGLAGRLARRLGRGVCVQVMAEGGAAAAAVVERAVP